MERFLVRNQVPKPDPGIVNRAAKAKQHRKLEKIVDATLHKRRKLETRSAFLHDYEVEEPTVENKRGPLVSYPYNVRKGGEYGQKIGKTADNKDRALNKVIRVHPEGEGHYGFMEIAGHEPATAKFRIAKPGSHFQEARPEKPGHVKYYRASGYRGANSRKWDEVAAGQHLRSLVQMNHLELPRQPLAPGLVPQRMRAIERK